MADTNKDHMTNRRNEVNIQAKELLETIETMQVTVKAITKLGASNHTKLPEISHLKTSLRVEASKVNELSFELLEHMTALRAHWGYEQGKTKL